MKFFFEKSEKNICLYKQSHSQILLKDYVFWHFSTHAGYPGRCGKMPNHSKIAPGGLGLCLYKHIFFPKKGMKIEVQSYTFIKKELFFSFYFLEWFEKKTS